MCSDMLYALENIFANGIVTFCIESLNFSWLFQLT